MNGKVWLMNEPAGREHYAFLISEAEFDAAFRRIHALDLEYWAYPMRERPREINYDNGGRGCLLPRP